MEKYEGLTKEQAVILMSWIFEHIDAGDVYTEEELDIFLKEKNIEIPAWDKQFFLKFPSRITSKDK